MFLLFFENIGNFKKVISIFSSHEYNQLPENQLFNARTCSIINKSDIDIFE